MEFSLNTEYSELQTLIDSVGDSDARNDTDYKRIKSICKRNNSYVDITFNLLMRKLPTRSAQLSLVPLFHELFTRSHRFRELMICQLSDFISITLENKKKCDLKLKSLIIKCVDEWDTKFSSNYPKLASSIKFVKQKKQMKPEKLIYLDSNIAEEKIIKKHQEDLLKKIHKQFNDIIKDIEISLVEIENGLQLLLPAPEDFDIDIKRASPIPSLRINTATQDEQVDKQVDNQVNKHENKHENYQENKQVNVQENNITINQENKQKNKEEKNQQNNQQNNRGDTKTNNVEHSHPSDYEPEPLDDSEASPPSSHRMHGINATSGYGIELMLGDERQYTYDVDSSEHNQPVVEVLLEKSHLVTGKYLQVVNRCYQTALKCNADDIFTNKLKKCRHLIICVVERLNRVTIDGKTWQNLRVDRNIGLDSESDDDDDFEDVPDKEVLDVIVKRKHEHRFKSPRDVSSRTGRETGSKHWSGQVKQHAHDPTTGQRPISPQTLKKIHAIIDKSTSDTTPPKVLKVKSEIATVPYGPDLVNWGEKIDKEESNTPRFDIAHRFWNREDHEIKTQEQSHLNTRVMHFSCDFKPITRTCRAQLMGDNGLCERKDKVKCPFHGVIIDRDESGKARNPEEETCHLKMNTKEKNYWDEKYYDEDGKEIDNPKSKSKKIKRKKKITPRKRLKKKIFNKSTLKRVGETLAQSDRKKFHDKFGNSFNYSYD